VTITNRVSLKSVNGGNTPIADVPDAPTIGAVTDLGSGSTASVAYTAAVTGGAATTFTATSTPGSLTGTGSSPITVSGLSSGVAYTFTVTASNSTGSSPASSASSSLTLAAVGAYESIASVTAAGGESSLTLSSIPQTYKHLQLRSTVRMNGGGNYSTNWYLRPNNNSTSSMYSSAYMVGNGTTLVGSRTNGTVDNYLVVQFSAAGNTTTANTFGASVIDIIDYASTTKLKTFRMTNGVDFNTASPEGQIALTSSIMNSTTAITSLVILDLNGYNFAAGSTFALYGIKG
jgi:hypothetical protein